MNKTSILAVAAAVLLSGSPALAADSASKKDDQDRKICKPEPNSVSRIARKICKTKAEWTEMNRNSVDSANLQGQR